MSIIGANVVVESCGARTSVGLTAAATAAAVRAGITGFSQHPYLVDTAGNKIIIGPVLLLDPSLAGAERLALMAADAVLEACTAIAKIKPALSIYVGLPPARPGRPKELESVVVSQIRQRLTGYRIAKIETIATGHAAGAMAVQAAWEQVRSGAVEFALAGGVDSYLEAETLEWLEENEQLHSAGEDNNPYGFIPGEAAGFVLLASAAAIERHQLQAELELVVAATSHETKLMKTDSVCTGEGLTALFRVLAGGPPGYRADHLYCDMNGEPYRADEYGFATVRAGELLRDASAFTAPADCWGDVGAASGPLYLLLMDAATRRGYAAGTTLAAFTSSETGERCGFLARSRKTKGAR